MLPTLAIATALVCATVLIHYESCGGSRSRCRACGCNGRCASSW
ncbi:MAG: hypothetical protein ACFE0R_05075 [Salinarimonas sp.]